MSLSFPSFEKSHCWDLCMAILFNQLILPCFSCSVRQRRQLGGLIRFCTSAETTEAPISMCNPEYLCVITESVCVHAHTLADRQQDHCSIKAR